jgi:hypothetical protein
MAGYFCHSSNIGRGADFLDARVEAFLARFALGAAAGIVPIQKPTLCGDAKFQKPNIQAGSRNGGNVT